MTIVALLGVVIAGGLGLAYRRLPPRRLMVCLAGFALGGALGSLPGLCLLIPRLQANSAEPFPFDLLLPAVLFLAGSVVGAIAGLMLIDRTGSRRLSYVWPSAAASAGLFTGALLALPAVALVSDRWDSACYWLLAPLAVAATTIAGYSLAVPTPPRG